MDALKRVVFAKELNLIQKYEWQIENLQAARKLLKNKEGRQFLLKKINELENEIDLVHDYMESRD